MLPGSPHGEEGATGATLCSAESSALAGVADQGALSLKWVGGLSNRPTSTSQPPTITTATAATATKNMIWLRRDGP